MLFLCSHQFLWSSPFKLLLIGFLNDDTLHDRTTIPVDDIVDLLDFCLSTTNFKYNNTHYQQIFGTAMGSPVSATMANLVMEDLEQRALSTSLVQPRFWKWYVHVDDVCATIKSSHLQTLQQHLKSIEQSKGKLTERYPFSTLLFVDKTVANFQLKSTKNLLTRTDIWLLSCDILCIRELLSNLLPTVPIVFHHQTMNDPKKCNM